MIAPRALAIKHNTATLMKRCYGFLLDRSGRLGTLLHERLRGRVAVLTYHRVLRDPALRMTWSHPGIVVSRDTFAMHLRTISQDLNPLSLAELIEFVCTSRALPARSCLVTFDDGWLDTYREAWPLLQEFRIPAVVFLPTSLITHRLNFWQEDISRLLHAAWQTSRSEGPGRSHAASVLASGDLNWLLGIPPDRIRCTIRESVNRMKTWPDERRAQLHEDLRAYTPSSALGADNVDQLMDWQAVRDMASSGVTFGAHGSSHRVFVRLGVEDLQQEVHESHSVIEDQLGCPPTALSYPNGDYNDIATAFVRQAGFQVAFTTRSGLVSSDQPRYELPRLNIHEDVTNTRTLFLSRMLSLF